MPKFMQGKVTITTLETYADTQEQADAIFKRFLEAETEQPELGVRAVQYKMRWDEAPDDNILECRNDVLAKLLSIMQNKVGGGLPKLILLSPPENVENPGEEKVATLQSESEPQAPMTI